ERQEFHGVQLRLALVLANLVERGLQEVGAVYAGNLHGILKGEKNTLTRAFLGVHLQQIRSLVNHLARSDIITVAPRQDCRQRAPAAAVWAHDGMDLARVDRQADALEDLLFLHARVEVFDFKYRLAHSVCEMFEILWTRRR